MSFALTCRHNLVNENKDALRFVLLLNALDISVNQRLSFVFIWAFKSGIRDLSAYFKVFETFCVK